MARYGRDFDDRYPSRGAGRYDRPDPGARAGYPRRYLGGAYPGGWDQWEGSYEGGGQRPRGYRSSPGGLHGLQTGQPWGGSGDAGRVLAGDLMTRNPEAVTPDTPLAQVAARMRDLDVGIIPVVDTLDDYQLQGVITDRDIAVRAAAEGQDMNKARAGDYMTEAVETVAEGDDIREIFTVMKRERVRRVPVTDARGRLVGIVAQADLAVEYAGVDLQREAEVEEVVERISEPARPNWRGGGRGRYDRGMHGTHGGPDLGDRVREGWDMLKREARDFLGSDPRRGYDRGWRR